MANPRIPLWPGYWTWPANPPNLLTTTLSGPVHAPFSLTDWPNPALPWQPAENRGFVHGVNILLISQDKFFAAPGEAPVYTWPNPPGLQQPSQADCQSSLLVGPLATPFHQTHWPNPHISGRLVQGDCQSSLLVGVLAVPFRQVEWPNPLKPGLAVQLEQAHNFLITITAVVTPFSLMNWPNPNEPLQPAENRGFVRKANVQLIGQDRFYGAPGEVPVHEWPNPSMPLRPGQPDQLVNFLTVTTVTAAPFALRDWPNPQISQRPAHTDCQSSTLVGPLAVPFRQLEWPNPFALRRPAQPDQSPNFLTVTTVTVPPFALRDWPNPVVQTQPQENRGFLHGTDVKLIGKDRFFAAPGQAPVYDWPLPQVPRQPQENKGFIGQPLVRFIGLDQFFAAPGQAPVYDWPLPQVARQPIQPEPPPNLMMVQPALFIAPEYTWTETTRGVLWIEPNRPVIWTGGNF